MRYGDWQIKQVLFGKKGGLEMNDEGVMIFPSAKVSNNV
jgi:hypothetical protein